MKKLLLFFFATVSVGLIGNFFSDRLDRSDHESNMQRISLQIQGLDQELLRLLTQINQDDIELQSLRHLWSEEGIGVVVYNENHAVDWTTSCIPFQLSYDQRTPPKQGIVQLKNAWYLCRSIGENGDLLVVYAQLRTEHHFENRYIRNGWGPKVNGSEKYSFTLDEARSYDIELTDGTSAIGLRNSQIEDDEVFTWNAMIWLVFLTLLVISLWTAANLISGRTSIVLADGFFIAMVVLLRALLLWWELPKALYDLELFGPGPHATSAFIPSLGDLMLHLITTLLVILRLTGKLKIRSNRYLQLLIGVVFPVLLFWPVVELFEILVFNSSFSLNLNSLFTLSTYSFVGLFSTFLTLLVYYLIFRNLFESVSPANRGARFILPALSLASILLALLLGFDTLAFITTASCAVGLGFLMLGRNWLTAGKGINFHIPSILVFSIIGCVILNGAETRNEQENRLAMARNIDQQQDPITEFLFDQLASDLNTDRKLRLALSAAPINADEVLDAIGQKLSYDHWNRYIHSIDIFSKEGGLLISDREQTGLNFTELQLKYENARPTISEQLRYSGNHQSDGGYLARVELEGKRNQPSLILFITLTPEKSDDILGFTDLFVDEEISKVKALEGYSYGLYSDGELREQHGNFAYSLSSLEYEKVKGENSFIKADGYSHLVLKPVEGRIVVVSKPSSELLAYLTTFSYLFLFYLMCVLLLSLVAGNLLQNLLETQSFRNRINLAMSSVSLVSLILIGLLTVLYVVNEYHDRNVEMISEKSRSVLIELEHKLADRQSFEEEDKAMLSALLVKFSKVFFTDINLYHVDGRLLATSRPRLYDEGLMAEVIDPTAYTQMRFGQRSSFIQEETLGNLNYLTAYVPFRNEKREVIAFMSLPYFARQYGLQQEIFALLAALINIYVFLILLSVVVALFISNRITEPLRFIRESLKNLKLDQTNRAIEWKSNDEIGELVEEYNRTLNELVLSAEMLARSERESAWREMAKQVAHEIKNPLTPMKLSIQMLQRSKNDGADDLDQRIDRVTSTLVEQIDALSNIATEFSSFAQMPKSHLESLDLHHVLESAVALHHGQNVKVTFQTSIESPCLVQADKDQMLRVFNNLIKNGIQSVPEERQAVIRIELYQQESNWTISISDNGSGIQEELRDRIFVPNFTTKSSGMGLGLAMVKNIVESMNGSIEFESAETTGTTFFITLPSDR